MKKQELIHLHGLLAEVQEQIETWNGEEIDLGAYEDHSVRPTSIHRSKTDHKEAVFQLADSITAAAGDSEEERVAATAD